MQQHLGIARWGVLFFPSLYKIIWIQIKLLSRHVSTRYNNVHQDHKYAAVHENPSHVNTWTHTHKHTSKDPPSCLTHLKLGLMFHEVIRSHVLHNRCVCFVLGVQQSMRVHESRRVWVGVWRLLWIFWAAKLVSCERITVRKRGKSAYPVPPIHWKVKPTLLSACRG